MKVKDLIKQLNELDPTGEINVCVGNVDIYFLSKQPAYYDGAYQQLIRDPIKAPYYDVVGGKYIKEGYKIQIYTLPIESILEDPKAVVDYSQLGPEALSYEESDNKTKEEWNKIHYECELNIFSEWCKEQAVKITGNPIDEYIIKDFFKTYYIKDKPLPTQKTQDELDSKCVHDSFNNRRKLQYDLELKLSYNGSGEWEFIKV